MLFLVHREEEFRCSKSILVRPVLLQFESIVPAIYVTSARLLSFETRRVIDLRFATQAANTSPTNSIRARNFQYENARGTKICSPSPTNQKQPLTQHQIGEVARVVHYLRKHTLHRTIASCTAHDDPIVYGKVGTSASAFQDAVAGRRVTGAGQQGKYFYMTFDKSPHAVMHLGMTGWVKFSTEETGYYRSKKESQEEPEWPPKYCKFLLKFEKETVKGEEKDEVEVAFIDARRLARIRLVECEEAEIRNNSPLKENGPDPVVDKEKFTVEFLQGLLRKKKVPVKALLLDQANISGMCAHSPVLIHWLTGLQASATGSRTRSSTKLASTPSNTATRSTMIRSSSFTTP